MTQRSICLAPALFVLCLVACNHTPRMPDTANTVQVWPVEYCPSIGPETKAAPNQTMFLGGIGELFLGTLIQAGVNSFSSALAVAAKKDLEGTVIKGQSARYLYIGASSGTGNSTTYQAQAARCLIVVVPTERDSLAFCDEALKLQDGHALKAACVKHRTMLDFAHCDISTENCARDGRKADPKNHTQAHKRLPKLYAEIDLRLATDKSAIKPALVNLYYPTAFDSKRSADERDLAFTIQLSSPDGKSIANMLIAKTDLLPADKQKPEADGVGLRVGAVNVTAEVRETGKVNAFLQAFAAAFEADKKKYADAIAAGVLPSAQQNAAVAKIKGEASVLEAQAALDKAKADYQVACVKAIGGDKGYANAEQKRLEVARNKNLINAAWQKLRAAQVENEVAVDPVAPAIAPCP